MTAPPKPAFRAYCLVLAGACACAVMALEVLAARTMAPHLGTGAVAWSALLAVALGALAVGNFAGGMLADRLTTAGIAAWALVIASAGVAALAHARAPLMAWSATLSLFAGALAAAGLTQAVPMILLGAVTPALLTAGGGSSRRARWAGAVLACGSAGGIVGALLAGLVLLPALGLTRSYLLVSGALATAAIPAALGARRWVAGGLALAVLATTAVLWAQRTDAGVIQSAYGQIELRRLDGGRVLLIDGLPQSGLTGEIAPGEGLRHGYLLEMALFVGRRPRDALVVGLGAALAPRLLEANGVACESVEIDPEVVRLVRRELGFDGVVHVADGRVFLAQSRRQWDLIVLDVCTSDRLAMHLFTIEAMRTVRESLSPDGICAMQFIGDDGPWSAAVLRTVRRVFPSAVCVAPALGPVGAWVNGPVGPRWIFAGRDALAPPPDFDADAPVAAMDTSPPWRVVALPEGGAVLTDDHFGAEHDWRRAAVRWRRSYAMP